MNVAISRNRLGIWVAVIAMLAAVLPVLAATPAHAAGHLSVTINEVRIDQPGDDDDEFFELAGASGTDLSGLTYLVIGDGTGGSGVIENVTALSGSSVPASGLFVAAESTFSLGTADLTATLGFENSDNVTHLLVDGFTGAIGDDLDTTDDGTLDVTPWSSIVDSVALVESTTSGELIYSATTVGPDGSFVPGHVYWCPAGWEIGGFTLGTDDTPGAANGCVVPPAAVTINEVRIDQPGDDDDEFFELAGASGTDLSGLTYLVIGDGTGGSGVIENVTALSGSSVPASGLFVAAESTFSLGTADSTATLGFENSDNVTHLLVDGFTGAIGDDLDTTDDGTLDVTPWSSIVDSVALVESTTSGELIYSATTVGPDGSFVPGHVYWCPAGWEIGGFTLGTDDTPGAANGCVVPPAAVTINEVRIDQPGDDDDEFFELAGASGTDLSGLTYLVIGDGTGGSGVIENVTALSGSSVPASGLFVAAESTFSLGTADLTATLGFENSDNVTHLLVDGFTGAIGDDLDTTDDGTLDVTPWSSIVDSVALVESTTSGELIYSATTVGPDGSFVPGHVYWCPAGWEIGGFTLGTDDTPGAANGCVVPPAAVTINEVRIDQPGDDDDEFFELAGASGTDLSGLTYLVIGDGTGGSGVIENVTALSGSSVPASGLFVAAESTFSLGTADLTATLGFENSDNVTHLLVDGFTGAIGDDLDTTDDGTLDVTPWSSIVDSVALVESTTSGELIYSATTVGPDGSFVPGHVYWCPAGWEIGGFTLGTDDTPGAANGCVVPPALVINEIMQDPSAVSDSAGEWFEIFNPTGSAVDIEGWTVADNGTNSFLIANGGPLLVPAGGFLVLGNNADSGTNGGVTVDYEYSGMTLANGDDEVVLLDGTLTEVDRVEYDGGPTFPDPNGASMSLTDPAVDNNVGGNWCTGSTPFGSGDLGTPGAANDCAPGGGDLGFCGDGLETRIHSVQGSGTATPIPGVVTIEGVVVADFEVGMGGIFVQEEDADADTDPLTSEGIFVFLGSFGPGVISGDVVRVRGTATEFFGLTEITSVTGIAVCSSGASVTPTTITLPLPSAGDWEFTEGMLVNISQTLYASGNFTWGRYGEVDLSVGGPLDNPTNVVAPGAPAIALQDLNDRSRIQLDDGSTAENPLPFPPYLGIGNTLRTGDTIPGLTGVLGYGFGSYEIHPTTPVSFTRANVRPAVPSVGGDLTVAAYNVLNYFTTLDGAGPICGPLGNQNCRGADNAFEFGRQRAKIVNAITDLDADVIGLMEIENYPGNMPFDDLVAGLNAVAGAGTYDYIATGAVGTDAIRQGILYKPASVTPVGAYAVLDSSVNPLFDDTRNRPVIAQTFSENGTGALFTVAVNHLKSKGSPCLPDDPDAGDGQGNCNVTRTNAAQALVDWLATDPTGSGDADFLIMGDLNAYAMEDPVTTIEAGGYTDLIESFVGSGFGAGAYSFNFFSQSGYLDHGLASPSLTAQVTGAAFWHVNADEPSGLDYNDYNQSGLYNADEYRSSDHDPIVVGLSLAPMEIKENVVDDLSDLLPTGDKKSDKRIKKAINRVEQSLKPSYWTSAVTLDEKHGGKVFDRERQAVKELMKVVDHSPSVAAAAAQAAIDALVDADRQLAQVALDAAITGGGDAGKIAKSQQAMAKAAAHVAAGKYDKAVGEYKKAWKEAVKAL